MAHSALLHTYEDWIEKGASSKYNKRLHQLISSSRYNGDKQPCRLFHLLAAPEIPLLPVFFVFLGTMYVCNHDLAKIWM